MPLFFFNMYFVYILYSAQIDRHYIGSTENIESRLSKHLSQHSGFTGKAKDWVIVYSEELASKTEALKRELEVKKWKSRKMIEVLILSAKK
jgi:putative endonuclease